MKFLLLNLFLVGLCTAQTHSSPHKPRRLEADRPVFFNNTGCVDYEMDGTWTDIPPYNHFDGFTQVDFDFDLGGVTYNTLYINDNGLLTFDKEYYLQYDPTSMPGAVPMVAPFWADNHLIEGGGIMRYKKFSNKIAILWADVWPYSESNGTQTLAYNTFSVVISNGKATEMGKGNSICFCYEKMEWTGGTDSNAVDGFGGISGTAGGVTAADGTWFQLGRFDRAGRDYHGPENADNEIESLNNVGYCIGNDDLGSDFPNIEKLSPGTGSTGDPHFTTYRGEHYEYHGQCDLVLAKDPDFADGLGLDIHLRTKLVRRWSYIKNAAIRVGNDILEVTGGVDTASYWINMEFQGDLSTLGGFPVTTNHGKTIYTIDLSSKYPGQSIQIKAYKEFVGVKLLGATAKAFGNTVGLLGDFVTGKTFARDGESVIDDFTDFGNEWQVRPSAEPRLFHVVEHPQFPEMCVLPEDPRGERRRSLGESEVSKEEAEAACSNLEDAAARKDCVYDVLTTGDKGMVGAY